MEKIIGTLSQNTSGAAVGNLHLIIQALEGEVSKREIEAQRYGESTATFVKMFQEERGLRASGRIDAITAERLNAELIEKGLIKDAPAAEGHTVLGRVTDSAGKGVAAEVTILQLGFRSEETLTTVKTDEEGQYSVTLDPKPAKGGVSIRAVAEIERQQVTSEPQYNIGRRTQIDLTAAARPVPRYSALDEVRAVVAPVLDKVPLADLRETDSQSDITYIAADRGVDAERLARVVLAERVGRDAKVSPDVIYGFLAQNEPRGLPTSLAAAMPTQAAADELDRKVLAGIVMLPERRMAQLLQAAVDSDLIAFDIGGSIEAQVKTLLELRPKVLRDSRFGPGKATLDDILESTRLTNNQKNRFVAHQLAAQEGGAGLWERVEADGRIPAARRDELRRTMTLGSFSKNHLPFVAFANEALPDKILRTPGLAAGLTKDDWVRLIEQGLDKHPDLIPENIDGEKPEDRIGAFAQMLAERAEQSFPTVAAVTRVAANPNVKLKNPDQLVEMIAQIPDADLRRLNLSAVRLGTNMPEDGNFEDPLLGTAVNVIQKLPEAAVSDLMRLQRAMRLAPNADATAALLASGHDAAHRIHAMGRSNFITAAVNAGMTELQAGQTLARAEATYGYLIARFLEFRQDMDKGSPAAIGGAWKSSDLVAELDNDPSLQTLFGSLDSCACDWCESVHGPAAYFTDVLRWLGQRAARGGSGFSTALDVLAARRPDLLDILLNCENTETLMPYIDLVNETLEETVAPTGTARQTTWRSEELMAEPEHVNTAAYTVLAGARHAPGLPFDLPHEESRVYLAHLQLSRAGIMEVFQDRRTAPPAPTYPEIAAAYFGLSAAAAGIITNAAPGNQSEFWAFVAPGELIPNANCQTLLARADITYAQLSDLLDTQFVNGTNPRSTFQPEFECDLIDRIVNNLSAARLDRMNRFIRLWRGIGWKMWELDIAITALGGNLNPAMLYRLMQIDTLARTYRLRIEEAVAMFADLDIDVRDGLTGDGRALYPDLFQNRAVLNPADPDLSIAAVTAAIPPALLSDKAGTIAASLAMGRADLDLLMPATPDPDIALPVAGDRASLARLTRIYRFGRLSRALGISVADLLAFLRLMGGPLDSAGKIDPFLSLPALTVVLRKYEKHKASGLSIIDSRHLITHWADSPLGLSDTARGANIEAFRTALADLRAETIVPPEDRAAALERQLPGVTGFEDAAVRSTILSIVDDSFAGTLAERSALIALHLGGLMDVTAATAAFAPYAGPAAGRPAAIEARQLLLLTAIYGHLARATITVTLAGQTGLEDAAAAHLAWSVTGSAGDTLGALLLAPGFMERTADDSAYVLAATPADMADLFAALALIDKLALIATKLGWDAGRLTWMMQNAGAFGLPDLSGLPIAAGEPALQMDDWLTLLGWSAAMSLYPETDSLSLPIILSQIGTPGYDAAQLAEDLAVWMQRSPDTVTDTIAALHLTYPADFRDVEQIERLIQALELVRIAGVDPAQMTGWAAGTVTAAIAQEMKLAVKARHDLDDWLEIAAPLQDRLRDAKRVALVTYLTSRPATPGQPRFNDATALYEHVLIDPEMTSCRKTSRLVLATGAVQLFVQRCLMNLEPDVLADAEADDDWNHWDWMASYRIWEASRKVFLWPENVIRPELNTRKSPQLQELEQTLSQGEVNAETAEIALERYLDTLDGIANLEVMAMHEQSVPSGREVHVLARTRAAPAQYYYRKQVFPNGATAAYWTSWSKVDLDIQGKPFFGFVNRKLYIFWLLFMAKPDPAQVMPPADFSGEIPPDTKQMWEIQLCWSMQRQGSFQAPRIGGRKLYYTEFRPERAFHCRTQSYSGNRLGVNIYVSTAPEFNDRELRTYDPASGNVITVEQDPTQTVSGETIEPIHVARFVFKRDVDEVQLTNRNDLHSTLMSSDVYPSEARETVLLASPTRALARPSWMHFVHQTIAARPANPNELNVTTSEVSPNRVQIDSLLTDAPKPFAILPPASRTQFDSAQPFFYGDRERSFFVRPTKEWRVDHSFTTEEPSLSAGLPFRVKYRFDRFYHPFTDFFLDELATGGLRGFYRRSTQLSPPSTFAFSSYAPDALVTADHEDDIVDFGFAAAYGDYNWELFLHVPWLIANRLAENQKFDEALAFLRHVFNPTDASSHPAPQRYWITKPFFQMGAADYNAQRIGRLLELVNGGSATHIAQVEQWRDNPFDPHMLARLRPVAYQRAIVMAYIDLLLDWGDREFRRYSTESLNLATQYYVRAAELLGRRPVTVPVDRRISAKSFREVQSDLDAFGNLLSEVENLLPPPPPGGPGGAEPLPPITIFYFCIPGNDKLLDYWDRVERNLFNLRHCRDISGVARPLPLFSPPIDPAMLVRAAAAGIDLSTLAGGAAVSLPHYRFRFMIQRAASFAADVERLGAALLSALEKRDEAELSMLREGHLAELHSLLSEVGKHSIAEAEEQIEALKEAEKLIKTRIKFYEKKKDTFVSVAEGIGFTLKSAAFLLKGTSAVLKGVSGGLYLIPEFQVGASGAGGSPQATAQAGGKQAGAVADKGSDGLALIADLADKGAELSFKVGYFIERQQKYEHEYDKANHEADEVAKRILAAEAHLEMARADLRAQERQIAQAREVSTFLTSRYTNKALYDWMVAQLSTVFFQAYKTAFDTALAAATCAEREVGLIATDYIGFGYWDSLRKGLMSGEKLSQDLRRLETAYLDRNKRSYEITKDVSVGLLDAEALLTLRATGACEIEVPEALFDMDYPGHYKRRLRTVAITIPTAAGPYTSVNAKLTLLRDEIRMTPSLAAGYARTSMTDDARFADNWAATRAIVTSKAVNDSGLHELRLEDDRYLPFEGAGAVGRWRIELPADTNAFDLEHVTDAILHLRYTAEEGGETLAAAARDVASMAPVRQSAQIKRLDELLAPEWTGLVSAPPTGQDQSMSIAFTKEKLPYLDRQRTVKVTRVMLSAIGAAGNMTAQITAPGNIVSTVAMAPDGNLGGRISGDTGGDFAAGAGLGTYVLKLRRDNRTDFRSLTAADLSGLYAIFFYDAES